MPPIWFFANVFAPFYAISFILVGPLSIPLAVAIDHPDSWAGLWTLLIYNGLGLWAMFRKEEYPPIDYLPAWVYGFWLLVLYLSIAVLIIGPFVMVAL